MFLPSPRMGAGPADMASIGWIIIGVSLWALGLWGFIALACKLWEKFGGTDYAVEPGVIAISLYFILTGLVMVFIGSQ